MRKALLITLWTLIVSTDGIAAGLFRSTGVHHGGSVGGHSTPHVSSSSPSVSTPVTVRSSMPSVGTSKPSVVSPPSSGSSPALTVTSSSARTSSSSSGYKPSANGNRGATPVQTNTSASTTPIWHKNTKVTTQNKTTVSSNSSQQKGNGNGNGNGNGGSGNKPPTDLKKYFKKAATQPGHSQRTPLSKEVKEKLKTLTSSTQKNQTKPGSYIHNRTLPTDKNGVPMPDSNYPHTQLGRSRPKYGSEPQAREWDYGSNGNLQPKRDIDFTDHGYPDKHSNPHQHKLTPNNPMLAPKGGYQRGSGEAL